MDVHVDGRRGNRAEEHRQETVPRGSQRRSTSWADVPFLRIFAIRNPWVADSHIHQLQIGDLRQEGAKAEQQSRGSGVKECYEVRLDISASIITRESVRTHRLFSVGVLDALHALLVARDRSFREDEQPQRPATLVPCFA